MSICVWIELFVVISESVLKHGQRVSRYSHLGVLCGPRVSRAIFGGDALEPDLEGILLSQ